MVGLTTTEQKFLISVVPMFQILFENNDNKYIIKYSKNINQVSKKHNYSYLYQTYTLYINTHNHIHIQYIYTYAYLHT